MDDLSAAPRPRLAAIKGALPSLNPPHQQPPLLSLDLLHPLHLDIAHRSHQIAPSEPVEPPQKEETIGATSSDTACTWSLTVDHNVAAYLADDRRSADELPYPLLTPPISLPVAIDDDGYEPLDHDLIVRPR